MLVCNVSLRRPETPANTVAPAISGTAMVGSTLTAARGTWTGSPTAYAYQWERDGADIGGATASTYLLVIADLAAMITVTVTASNTAGSNSATSAGVGPVAAAGTIPANTVAPVISGTTEIGSTLSTTDGTWTGTAPITYAFQWKRGGSNISGATSSSYLLDAADLAATITVTVTATNINGSANATSSGVGPVTSPTSYTATYLSQGIY